MKNQYLTTLLILALGASTQLRADDASIKEVAITATDQMKFNVTHIDAHPGQTIHVVLTNQGTMPKELMGHNWVLLKAGVDVNAYANAAISAAKENYQPKSHADQVLASIPLLGPKKEGEVTFTAPDTPGTYYYLCSFPAHAQSGMRGELVVK